MSVLEIRSYSCDECASKTIPESAEIEIVARGDMGKP